MAKLLANELQPGKLLRIFDGKKYIEKTVKKMIVMQGHNARDWTEIYDVEILLCKRKNHYFSYHMYLKGTSWVKEIEIIESR